MNQMPAQNPVQARVPTETIEDLKHNPLEQGFIAPQVSDYYNRESYQQPYGFCDANKCISRPSIININNVNAVGNTFIIYGNQPIIEPHFNNPILDPTFEITIDKEYYSKKYSIQLN
eukprot:TRINITY_DN5573_c0_g1_i1.p1 TRINITY_DN5573_c0_g1~~TRINITY_DN5573_c0_g1_i1.p1  ORF type:complete len:117 (+),score=24.04 TRINITY_DN5573_c0_g1_i1:333-683(+)